MSSWMTCGRVWVLLGTMCVVSYAAEPKVPVDIRQSMQARDYEAAIKLIDAVEDAQRADLDYLAYLKGRALHFQGKYDEAVASFDAMLQAFPKSEWNRRARFAKAVALARKGAYQDAEVIYRAEATYLLSLDRKQEIAAIYIEFADAYFKPPQEDVAADYNKALEFYQKAVEVGPQLDQRVKLELLIAECHEKLDQRDQAIALYQQFIRHQAEHDLVVEARFRLGETYLADSQYVEARRAWEDLLDLHKGSDSPRMAEAMYRLSLTYEIPDPPSSEELSLGVAALEAFIEKFPQHELAAEAALRIGKSYQAFGRYEDAASSYRAMLANKQYQQTAQRPEAMNYLGETLRQQNHFDAALKTWKDFLKAYPTNRAWSVVQRKIIDTEFAKAEQAYAEEDFAQARTLWTQFLAKYPLDQRNRGVLFRFGQIHYAKEEYQEAIAQWRQLISKYPDKPEARRAQYMIGYTLEYQLAQFEEALQQYRKIKPGNQHDKAQQQIRRLTAKSMRVASERIYRSNETPKVKLLTRNIEEVTVNVYRVDMETYFRKMHLATGVEKLDIALIDPDATFQYQVPEYAEYQRHSGEIEIRLPEEQKHVAGVMAVTVSSKTLEATTMVVQTDLDIIVKSSRDELFVFAQNMRTGKAWPQVRVLVSDGKQVFGQGETGDDGVFHKPFAELKSSEDVRVFAMMDDHSASNVIDLEGLGMAQGLTPRGYIYTDRPAYRPGDLVHVRGVLRKVSGDTYQVEKGKEYQVEIFDTRDRLVTNQQTKLTEFGTFHVHFRLPTGSPQGQYRVRVFDKDKQNYQGMFQVHDYQLDPIRLTVDTERSVYYRGEEISGTIKAEYYYGAPLADRQIQYQLADGRVLSATTDKEGLVRFQLPTRDYRESQTLGLVVTLPERNLQITKPFYLSTTGFMLSASTVREVYLAGEPFEVTVTAMDAEGEPVARDLQLQVLRITMDHAGDGEVEQQTHALQSDREQGTARHAVRLEEGGAYVLRVHGEDRFGNAISTDTMVNISDDEDRTRLRILADVHSYDVGDTAKVKIHWRDKPALALVTFQGAKILDYQLVALKTGNNPLMIPMTAKLAPNFNLSVTLMTDARNEQDDDGPARRFHEATSSFFVSRKLHVDVAIQRRDGAAGAPRPGEEVELKVTTTDPQGKPRAAEVSLAMVEQALLSRFARSTAPIDAFFRSQPRQSAVRTNSSIVFAYRPPTQRINRHLLAETERLAVEEEEARALELLAEVTEETGEARLVEREGMELDDELSVWNENDARDNLGFAPNDHGEPFQQAEMQQMIAGQGGQMGGGFGGGMGLGGMGGGGFFGGMGGGGAMGGGVNASGFAMGGEQMQSGNADRGQQWFNSGAAGSSVLGRATYGGRLMSNATGGVAIHSRNLADVQRYFRNYSGTQVMLSNGIVQNVAVAQMDETDAQAELQRLAQAGGILLNQVSQQDTGYWNPGLVTDAQGQAVLTITLPEKSTGWNVLARGVTADTLAGEATTDLVVKKSLFGQLKLPASATDGDQSKIVASIHKTDAKAANVEVVLQITTGEIKRLEKKTLELQEPGVSELTFEHVFSLPGDQQDRGSFGVEAIVELTVRDLEDDPTRLDRTRRSVPVRPYGLAVFSTKGGTAAGDALAIVEQPKGMQFENPQLQVLIGPSVERSLLDVVLGPPSWCSTQQVSAQADRVTGDLLASLALQQLLDKSRDEGNPQAVSLDARIRSLISLLVATQNEDGGWSWTGVKGASDRYHTARVVWAMARARQAGYRMAPQGRTQAETYLNSQIAQAKVDDYETKTVLLHALAVAGQGDFPLANQLYRNRQALSPSALAHLALTFAEMDRGQTATELLTLLTEKHFSKPADLKRRAGKLGWMHSQGELRALYALTLEKIQPANAALSEQVKWLMEHRVGLRWTPEKATGPAMEAICAWYARTRFEGEKYKLSVYVNDRLAKELEVDGDARTQTIDVPAKLLRAGGRQDVRFVLEGRARFTYQCVLAGYVPVEKLTSTTKDWQVERFYQPAPLEIDGRQVNRGFGILQGSYQSFRNPMTQLPVGKRGQVELRIRRHHVTSNVAAQELPYLVVTEPLPAGTSVIENSVQGGFERYELSPGAITFYLGTRSQGTVIRYALHGYLPGSYRVAPTVVRNAYVADEIAVATSKQLQVLPAGERSADAYRLTPVELFELGKYHYGKGNLVAAGKHLEELVSQWNLNQDVYRETVRRLLDVYLQEGPANRVVKYFEIIIEKFPELEIPFSKLLKVGAAYDAIGEYERSYLVFRATIEASFLRESRVAGVLQNQGEFTRSVAVMSDLLREYPPEPYLATAKYALAQRVYAKAPEAAADKKLREAKLTRVDLIRQAWAMLEGFLTAHPEDPAADQAAFSIANAMLDLEFYEQTIEACDRFAKRYPKSRYLDSFWYIVGYCQYALGEHQAAMAMCHQVSNHVRTDPRTGRREASENKWRAIYILGQIQHSLGKAAAAIQEYERVKDRFVDARQAIEYFTRKQMELPEVTTFQPQEEVQVELGFRNVAECNATVYKIDLMKFSLLRRDLGDITKINLSGIRPYFEKQIELGDGKDYRDRTVSLELPLREEGAYLVVCRGANLHASGLVLVTPLSLEIQEEVSSGRVRATVRDVTSDRYLQDVHVKVIGSRNPDFISGDSDLRGVFVADGVQGRAMVLARGEGSRYAFFRGERELGPPPEPAQEKSQEGKGQQQSAGKAATKEQLLEGLNRSNSKIQREQTKQLDNFYDNNIQQGIGGGFGGGFF